MQRAVVNISSEAEENIGRILQDVRKSSSASESNQSRFPMSRDYSGTDQTGHSSLTSSQSFLGTSGTDSCSSSAGMTAHACVGDVTVDSVSSAAAMTQERVGGDELWMDCSEPYVSSPLDKQMKVELLERQTSNSKYKKMLVSISFNTYCWTSLVVSCVLLSIRALYYGVDFNVVMVSK